MQRFRRTTGGIINRDKPVSFNFDGRVLEGYAGDTLASALLANGVHMVARSFKYHRPRGILGAGSEDPAALVQAGRDKAATDANTRATELELFNGLAALPQNCWPSLAYDLGAVNDLLWRWLPAGFYYKTFMGPPGSWMFFEPFIRKAAGLGKAPEAPDPDHYESQNRHCDVLVVGGGPAGLMAAAAAAKTGARVILCEETPALGGRLLSVNPGQTSIAGLSPLDWVRTTETELRATTDVTVLTRTCAFGYYADNFVGLLETEQDHLPPHERDPLKPRQRLWRVRASQVVLATGAIERPLVFHGNDRPGIMLASAVDTYIHRYGVLPGRRAVVFTNNSGAWDTAFGLADAGITVAGIVDLRPVAETQLVERAQALGIPVYAHSTIVETRGRKRLRMIHVRQLDGQGGVEGEGAIIPCDLLAVSGGWSPNVALFSQSRGKLRFDPVLPAFRPSQSWQAERSVGAANGAITVAQCLAQGRDGGTEAGVLAGFAPGSVTLPPVSVPDNPPYAGIATWLLPSGRSSADTRAFVDLQNDVQAKDLQLAAQEGYRSVEHAKRYTTTGMGTDQGKTVGINAFGIIAETLGRPVQEVGVTTYRQPFKPVTFGAIAGQHGGMLYAPRRLTPMHDWHEAAGAVFEPVGEWLRAQTYPKLGESFAAAVQREARAVRSSVGVLDASTLGKIDIVGPDARQFLNRVYTNGWLKLAPGRCRYGLMLKEDGMVFDDGVTACLDDQHFHMTTTTGGAARVLAFLEDYLQTEWTDLEVFLTSVTEQWAVAAISGPKAADVMAAVVDGCDCNPGAFPFMSMRQARIGNIPARVFRISFTGELSYEINVPSTYGLAMWERVMAAGAKYGITAYGTEAMHLLRAEKGFIIVGQDTDGTVAPGDLRMAGMVKDTADFIGRRSLSRADTARGNRRQLVGLLTEDPAFVPMEGAHIIATPDEPAAKPVPTLGHITSSYMSPNVRRSIALALIKGGGERIGETVYISRRDGPPVHAVVVEPDFMSLVGGRS